MAYWIRVENDIAQEYISNDPDGVYPDALVWLQVPEAQEKFLGLTKFDCTDNITLTPQLDTLKESLRVKVRELRWLYESYPVTHSDRVFSANREHRQLMAEYIETANTTNTLLPFKLRTGDWWTPSALSDVRDAYAAVLSRVSAAFEKERVAMEAINAATTADGAYSAYTTSEPTFNLA